jgi:hypothetical protein
MKHQNGKTKTIRFRCDQTFRTMLSVLAEKKHICLSELIRKVITENYLNEFNNK